VHPEHGVADRVDAVVHRVQSTSVALTADRRRREPEREQLPARHDAVLVAGEPRDQVLG